MLDDAIGTTRRKKRKRKEYRLARVIAPSAQLCPIPCPTATGGSVFKAGSFVDEAANDS